MRKMVLRSGMEHTGKNVVSIACSGERLTGPAFKAP